jgi:NTE family protein
VSAQEPARPRVGVALGGGSARGLAHVGVLRWFEEHRIPIDVMVGTSMGGLVGGAFASGWSSAELATLLEETDWDTMFGGSSFKFRNVRRKLDGRAYPSRIEFGLKGGLTMPEAINNGQQVELMLARIAAVYGSLDSFDVLPTPFRAVSVDLLTAERVVLDRGSLARAMRATMSLPGVFPPVEMDGRVLVDGGAMNNVPADVVRDLGADVVIAVNVGAAADKTTVNYTIFGLMGGTVDAMMRASTREAMKAATIVITPALDGFGSLDWRRNSELAEQGYRAAEAIRDQLLPLALGEQAWADYVARRRERRRDTLPVPAFVQIEGAASADERTMVERLEPQLGQPINLDTLEATLATFGGLDRYDSVGWELTYREGEPGLLVRARSRRHAPPFFMLGIGLENTTTGEFSFELAGRYLTFDAVGSGSEMRIDAAAGSTPSAGVELLKPLGTSHLFWALTGQVKKQRLNLIQDDRIVAQYDQARSFVSGNVGVDLTRESELRLGVTIGWLDASVHAGDPGLPEIQGRESLARLRWLFDSQDSPIIPSSGIAVEGRAAYFLDSPELPPEFQDAGSNQDLLQADIEGSIFWSVRARGRDRVFVIFGAGTSFDGHPLATHQFQLGRPLRLGAYDLGEVRGNHYLQGTLGYLRGVGRLPDFLGGLIMLGGWVENGSAFNDWDAADLKNNVGFGVVGDTLVGPVIVGASIATDNGDWRYYVGIGRIFR